MQQRGLCNPHAPGKLTPSGMINDTAHLCSTSLCTGRAKRVTWSRYGGSLMKELTLIGETRKRYCNVCNASLIAAFQHLIAATGDLSPYHSKERSH